MEQPITIQQELSLKEYLKALLYFFFSSRRVRLYFLLLFIAMLLSNLLDPKGLNITALAISILPLAILVLIFMVLISALGFFTYKTKSYLFHNVSYDLTDWGIKRKGGKNQFEKPWNQITRCKESKSFFFLIAGELDAHILQKRMFTDEFEMEQFRDLLRANNLQR